MHAEQTQFFLDYTEYADSTLMNNTQAVVVHM